MELRADRFGRQLAGEPLRPAYLIAGSEPLIVQECADAVRAKAREEGYDERQVLEAGKDFDWNDLSMGLAAMSLFASRRLFDLRLPTGKPDRDGSKALLGFCENPPPETILLVTAQEWSQRHAGKWSEAIARIGHVVVAWPVKPGELEDWLERRLRGRGLVADPGALQVLAERVEGNLLAAAQEVEKLALLAPGERLDAARMQALVADSARYDIFRLVEAALAGDAARSVRMLHALRAEGGQVPGLLPILAMELVKLVGIARRAAQGGNLMSALREAHVWESKQALYRRALERHPASNWEQFAAEAGRIDLVSKGRGSGDAWLGLERLLLAMAKPRARALLAG